MKKILLVLLFPLLVFANDYKSHFFAGGAVALSKIVDNNDNYDYMGNGDIFLYGGWEYRPVRWFSLAPTIGFERHGWSWDRAGHKGSISYFNPYLQLELGFHIKDFYIGGEGGYGYPIFFWGEIDGKSTTDDEFQETYWSCLLSFKLGYTIKEHYRVGLTSGLTLNKSVLVGVEERYNDGTLEYRHIEAKKEIHFLGIFFTYLF